MNIYGKIGLSLLAVTVAGTGIYLFVKNKKDKATIPVQPTIASSQEVNPDASLGITNLVNNISDAIFGNNTTDNSVQTPTTTPVVVNQPVTVSNTSPDPNSTVWLQANTSTNIRQGYAMTYPSMYSYDSGEVVGFMKLGDYNNTNPNSWMFLSYTDDNNNMLGMGYIQKKDVDISSYSPDNT